MPSVLIPTATVRLLPEGDGMANDDQPAIVPTQIIEHTAVDGAGTTSLYNYWLGVNLESHCYIGRLGNLEQYMRLDRRADANYKANRRPDNTGAISFETWDGRASGYDAAPLNDAQLLTAIAAYTWLCKEWNIPPRLCPSWDAPGIGYHKQFPEWSYPGPTGCPGDPKKDQLINVIIPAVARNLSQGIDPTLPIINRRDRTMQEFTNVYGLKEWLDIDPRTGRLRNTWETPSTTDLGMGSPVDGVFDSVGPANPIVDPSTKKVVQVWFQCMGSWAGGTPITVMQQLQPDGSVKWTSAVTDRLRKYLASQPK